MAEAAATPDPERALVPTWVKQALAYVGVTGAGGGGFAALCFAIGFLATRSHDEMLGLPTWTGAYGAMVRIGAMFFPNSLYCLLFGTWKATAAVFAVALAGWAIAEGLRRRRRAAAVAMRPWARIAFFLVAHGALLGIGLLLFEDRAATLHQDNRSMLLARSSEQDGPVPTTAAASFRYFVWDRLPEKAARVRAELRADPQADPPTRKHYGQSVALLGLFIVLLALEHAYWRTWVSRMLQWLIRSVLYGVAVVLIVTLPAAYGVLWLPNNATYVEIATAPTEAPVIGYLLTDISSDDPDVWTLTLADTTFAMRVFKRESISEIRVIANASTDNLLRVPIDLLGVPDGRTSKGDAGGNTR